MYTEDVNLNAYVMLELYSETEQFLLFMRQYDMNRKM
jgi:hypothetical protein